jgi:hypothetical protein
MSKQGSGKRSLFDEIMEGVESMKSHREGGVVLRTRKIPVVNATSRLQSSPKRKPTTR